jgi:hypothetical protein
MIRKFLEATHSAQAGIDGYAKLNRLVHARGEYIFLASMPKSGSTFTRRALEHATGFETRQLCYACDQTEQELYLPRVVDAFTRPTVSQQHTRATDANLEMMRRFGIRPVIIVRDVFDCVVSLAEHLFREGIDEYFSGIYATPAMAALNLERRHDLLITFALPWYFSFFASWHDACRAGRVDALWTNYKALTTDWAGEIGRILGHYGITKSRETLERAVADTLAEGTAPAAPYRLIRLNRGVAGRGRQLLTASQQDRIREMAGFYPWVDFSAIGLEREDSDACPGVAGQAHG